MSNMFVDTIGAVSTGVSAFELSQKMVPGFKKIFKLLKDGELKIAIFGAGGTGKTTLGKVLSGEFELSSLFQPYQESISIEQYKLDSNVVGSVIVAPGQIRREDTWDDLFRTMAGGKFKLIIHTVSWGYHSFGEVGYTQHRLYQNGMTATEFIESSGANELLVPTTGGYDQRLKLANFKKMIETIEALSQISLSIDEG
jgi:hypothetical protein